MSYIFYRFENDRIISKNMQLKWQVYNNQKLCKKLRQTHYAKNNFLWFMLGHMSIMRIIKL